MPVEQGATDVWLVGLDGAPAKRIDVSIVFVHDAVVAPDGSWIAANSDTGTLYAIDAASGVATAIPPFTTFPVGWSSDGGRLVTIRDGVLRLVDPAGIEPTTELAGVLSAAWVGDRDVLVLARRVDQGLSIDAVAEDGGEIRNIARIDDIEPTGPAVVTVDLSEDQQ